MENRVKQPKWKVVEYPRSKIINAGKTIRQLDCTDEELYEAIKVIDNWRAAHAFPLQVYMHLRRMWKEKENVVVAERLKRLDSIVNKLKRESSMNLWTMQDLGGCRVIVPTIDDVYQFANEYENSRKRHIKKKEYDYIKEPKQSGYRSLHVVYEYHSDREDTYNKNMLIEIQFRTHLQHMWATAVETMGLFRKETIKSGQGSDDVKRFFVLCSALLSIREKQPIVSSVAGDIDKIVQELKDLNVKKNYLSFLRGISAATVYQNKKQVLQPGYCILILNYDKNHLMIRNFRASDFSKANETYNAIESRRIESKIDAVLVRVSSFKELRMAYPNYFSDISEFVKIIESYLE